MQLKGHIWLLSFGVASFILSFLTGSAVFGYDSEAQPWRELNLVTTSGKRNSTDVNVLFATTRLNEGNSNQPRLGNQRHLDLGNGSLIFGVCNLQRPSTITNSLDAGHLMSYQSIFTSNYTAWQSTPTTAINLFTESDFYNQVSNFQGTVCVFIHGFDKPFESAIRDGAQLSDEFYRRTGGHSGPFLPIVFSWPSQGSKAQYSADEATVEWSREAFITFMNRLILAMNPQATLNVVAHSMGNRLVVTSPERLLMTDGNPRITNILLCSPDVDMQTFEYQKSKVENLAAGMVYVFVCDRDGALITSQTLHLQPRLGRPIDLPQNESPALANVSSNLPAEGFINKFLSGVMNINSAIRGEDHVNDTLDVQQWLAGNPALERELGPKTRFIDVTDLNTGDVGHRLAIPVVAGLMLKEPDFSPFHISVVHKRPDCLTLLEMGRTPLWLYRYYKLTLPN